MPDQTIFPYLYVQDVRGYLDFLHRAFGFEQRMMHEKEKDHVHAEAALGDAVVMIGCATARFGTSTPRQLGTRHAALYVMVEDADAHCAHARKAGARIIEEPTDQEYGHRRYTARDPEDQEWYFASPLS